MSYFSDLFPCKKIVSLGINFFEIFVRFSFYCSRWDVRFVFSANRLEGWMQIEAIRLFLQSYIPIRIPVYGCDGDRELHYII